MTTWNVITASSFLLLTSLILCNTGAVAQQHKAGQHATTHQLSKADEKAIRDIIKNQETTWNKHDMKAFTQSFREDAEGINIVGMYWRGKAQILKHLTDYHNTLFKNLEEYLEDVQIQPIGDGYAIAVIIWKVGSFTAPSGVVVPAARHRSTQVLAKGKDGWKVVHFHNTTIDEMAVKAAAASSRE